VALRISTGYQTVGRATSGDDGTFRSFLCTCAQDFLLTRRRS
jgi:hypothetical protein